MIFLSHSWKKDEEGRDNHRRIMRLANALHDLGWSCWFDETHLTHGNIDTGMADGIEQCAFFIACLTRAYIDKVNQGVRSMPIVDNCAKEWNYAIVRAKPIIPVVMEKAVANATTWSPGVVSLFIANCMHVRAVDDDWKEYAFRISSMLRASQQARVSHSNQNPFDRLVCHRTRIAPPLTLGNSCAGRPLSPIPRDSTPRQSTSLCTNTCGLLVTDHVRGRFSRRKTPQKRR